MRTFQLAGAPPRDGGALGKSICVPMPTSLFSVVTTQNNGLHINPWALSWKLIYQFLAANPWISTLMKRCGLGYWHRFRVEGNPQFSVHQDIQQATVGSKSITKHGVQIFAVSPF